MKCCLFYAKVVAVSEDELAEQLFVELQVPECQHVDILLFDILSLYVLVGVLNFDIKSID
jgi:hypothetical protein